MKGDIRRRWLSNVQLISRVRFPYKLVGPQVVWGEELLILDLRGPKELTSYHDWTLRS
jgi:hypothetical protein